MRIVVDASVALKWVFDEPESEAAVALRSDELIAHVVTADRRFASAANVPGSTDRVRLLSN